VRRARSRRGGFTLTELLVVMLVLAAVAGLGSIRLRRRNREAEVAGMARELHLLAGRARVLALSSRSQVRLRLDPEDSDGDRRVATLHVATTPGFNPQPLSFGPAEASVGRRPDARIAAVAQGADVGGAPPVGPAAVTSVTFFPDGAARIAAGAQGATLYLEDAAASNAHRVVIFGRTGFAKVLDR